MFYLNHIMTIKKVIVLGALLDNLFSKRPEIISNLREKADQVFITSNRPRTKYYRNKYGYRKLYPSFSNKRWYYCFPLDHILILKTWKLLPQNLKNIWIHQ